MTHWNKKAFVKVFLLQTWSIILPIVQSKELDGLGSGNNHLLWNAKKNPSLIALAEQRIHVPVFMQKASNKSLLYFFKSYFSSSFIDH